MAFSDFKMVLSLNLELKNVKGNFIWSLVLALISNLISASALTLSLKFILKPGQRDSPIDFDKNYAIFGHIWRIFDFNQWNNDFRLYESMSLERNLSLHPVNHHQEQLQVSSFLQSSDDEVCSKLFDKIEEVTVLMRDPSKNQINVTSKLTKWMYLMNLKKHSIHWRVWFYRG